jgi:pimeloyl-ACP methyl ester carboxylesterase
MHQRAVHPLTTTRVQIDGLLPAFTVHAIDMRGHGHSSSTLHSKTPGEVVPGADVLAVLQQLGLHKPLVFGHSLGGTVAMLVEVRQPGTWGGMALFEPIIAAWPEEVRSCRML